VADNGCTRLRLPPVPILFGYGCISQVLAGKLAAPGLTSFGYVIVLLSGAASAACFGTVFLRLVGMRCAWLGGVGLLLCTMAVLLGLIAMALALTDPLWLLVGSVATIAIMMSAAVVILERGTR